MGKATRTIDLGYVDGRPFSFTVGIGLDAAVVELVDQDLARKHRFRWGAFWMEAVRLAREQYDTATNMTDRYTALSAAVAGWTPDAEALLGNFRIMYTADPLVFDKWLVRNAMAPIDNVVSRIEAILALITDADQPRAGHLVEIADKVRPPIAVADDSDADHTALLCAACLERMRAGTPATVA